MDGPTVVCSSTQQVDGIPFPPPPPTKTLLQKIKRRDWEGARDRLRHYPWDAQYTSRRGNQVPLHFVCLYRAPIDVVELLADVHPDAIIAQDTAGWTPIHLVIMHGGDKQIAILLIRKGGLSVALQSPLVGTPLHLACRHGSPIDILEELIEANASMAGTANDGGIKPAEVVWFQFLKNPANREFVRRIVHRDGGGDANSTTTDQESLSSTSSSTTTVDDLLARLRLLVGGIKQHDGTLQYDSTTIDGKENEAQSSGLSLHEIVANQSSLGDLSEFLVIAIHLFPEQLRTADDDGNFVLHLAVSNPPITPSKLQYGNVTNRNSNPLPQAQLRDSTLIDLMISAFPTPVGLRNHGGDYPLHLALTVGRRTWKTGVGVLVKANSQALTVPEQHTRFYPFQLSAAFSVGCANDEEWLETIFQLLVACPHVLQS
jgi:ankyrin repeat protein